MWPVGGPNGEMKPVEPHPNKECISRSGIWGASKFGFEERERVMTKMVEFTAFVLALS